MFDYKKKDAGKRTIEFEVIIPKGGIAEYYKKAFDVAKESLQVEGFRKGKAPADIAKKHLKKEAVYDRMLQIILPDIYKEVIQKEALRPVVNPKFELLRAKEGEDWQLKLTVALAPAVKLGDYRKVVSEVKKGEKAADIWVPGKDAKPEDEAEGEKKKIDLLNKILEAVLKSVEIEMSELIIEEELSRKLTQLVDDVRKIGMSVEDYLKSKNTTIEEVRDKFKKEITDTYKLELALEHIANDASITVEKSDLDKVFENITDQKARGEAESNAYFYASILKRQKTLDYLASL